MKTIINGAAGHMGQALIKAIGETPDIEVVACVDRICEEKNGSCKSLQDYQGPADVIIDFSNHACTHELVDYALSRSIPLVIATTGQDEEEKAYIRSASGKIPVFNAGNFSLGIAVLSSLAVQAVRMFPTADVEIIETHHDRKEDVPSGTALMLANAISKVKKDATTNIGRHENGKRKPNEIGIHSVRRGDIVGIHEIIISTDNQTISLKHEAHNRALFADGAIEAARFVVTMPAGFYDMEDVIRK